MQTGAIENLYQADRGFTFTVALQSAMVEQSLAPRPRRERTLIEDQLRVYEHVLDFATRSVPVAEAWIRRLHEELCKSQETYEVRTPQGMQEQALPLGVYKSQENVVKLPDGGFHFYAPVARTPMEMERLVAQLRSDDFGIAHPILQAAYAHHALTVVHPFADGNGRVARALGSVFTCRAWSLPLLIFEDQRDRYFGSLKDADAGEPQPFVEFLLECVIGAVRLVRESFRVAAQASSDTLDISSLLRTIGGFEHSQVDQAASHLRTALVAALQSKREALLADRVDLQWERSEPKHTPVG